MPGMGERVFFASGRLMSPAARETALPSGLRTAAVALAQRWAGLLVFAVALLARLYDIAAKPYWMDEVTTLQRANRSLLELIADSLSHHHLPAYFVITSWLTPFGDDEGVMRLPSAVFGAAACWTLYRIGRKVGGPGEGRGIGLAAGLLLALSPMQVQYGQEARSYALLTWMIAVALHGLVSLALEPRRAALPWRHKAALRRNWAEYVFGTVAALNVLSVALFWVAAASLSALLIARGAGLDRRQFLRNWLLAHGVVAALSLPWFVAMYVLARGQMASGLDWVPALTPERLWSTLSVVYLHGISSLISFRLFPSGVPWFGPVVIVMAAAGVLALWRGRSGALAALALGAGLLPASLAAISLVHPVWMPRYVLWSAVPFFGLVGAGVAVLPRRLRIPAALAVGVLGAWNLAPYYDTETKPRWDLAAADLRADLRPGDLVLADDPAAIRMMNVYLKRTKDKLVRSQWTGDVGRAAAALAQGARVWAVQGTIGQADERTIEGFLDKISPLGEPAVRDVEGLDVVLLRFDPPGPPAPP